MSDILDLQSHCDSDLLEESEHSTVRLKNSVKRRKGRGFETHCESELTNIKYFESLEPGNRYAIGHPQKSVEGWVLFVTGLHEEASEEDVREVFSEYGAVSNIAVNMDRRTGFLKGYALVEFKSFQDADSARENLNESSLLNRTIYVNWCFSQDKRKVLRTHYKW